MPAGLATAERDELVRLRREVRQLRVERDILSKPRLGLRGRASSCTLEAELLSRRRFASQAEAKMACFSYIEGWYNPACLYSGMGY